MKRLTAVLAALSVLFCILAEERPGRGVDAVADRWTALPRSVNPAAGALRGRGPWGAGGFVSHGGPRSLRETAAAAVGTFTAAGGSGSEFSAGALAGWSGAEVPDITGKGSRRRNSLRWGAGVALEGKRFQAGLSATGRSGAGTFVNLELGGNIGAVHTLINIRPSVLAVTDFKAFRVQTQAEAVWKQTAGAGGGYRWGRGPVALAWVRIAGVTASWSLSCRTESGGVGRGTSNTFSLSCMFGPVPAKRSVRPVRSVRHLQPIILP